MPKDKKYTSHVPKTQVQDWRKAFYDRAYYAARAESPDMLWSDWVRRSLDREAIRQLKEPLPTPEEEDLWT